MSTIIQDPRGFAVINESKYVDASDAQALVQALALQFRDDFAPIWNEKVLEFDLFTPTQAIPDDCVPLYLSDVTRIPDAFGDHYVQGTTPIAEVLCEPITQNGAAVLTGQYSIAVTASHEALEAARDLQASYFVPRVINTDSVALEVADPVQTCIYQKGGVSVSDFVTPYWFDDSATIGRSVDFMNAIKLPFELAPGGYMIVRKDDGSTSQVFSEKAPPAWWLASRRRSRQRLREPRENHVLLPKGKLLTL